MILAIDKSVRRYGRLSLSNVTEVMEQIEKDGSVTDTQSLLLIRCMGTTLPEIRPEERTAIVNQMWDKMLSLGATYNTQHYNALLRVYLQNEHKFSPTDFLASMDSNKVTPNRVTYQRLVARYCQDGDIKGPGKAYGCLLCMA
ncbi:leucine-rich PPR motif-containing protein, mitochondrial-like [Liolophura sinensis]|uniref:leucine-rich PPR motif-containing protein, mitochondrial-like n=1 Tax=Liolophura sinensis TaxID=3198878 RepID=UPI003158AE0C